MDEFSDHHRTIVLALLAAIAICAVVGRVAFALHMFLGT